MPKDDLSGKNLDNVDLSDTDMSGSDLSKASLRRAQFKGAKLQNANLAESDLHGAQLQHADPAGTDLRNADLSEADLRGVDLRRTASVDGARLSGAKGVPAELASAGGEPEQVRVGHVLEEVADLNRQIIGTVQSLSHLGKGGGELTEHERRRVIDRIVELRQRRDHLEDRLIR